MTMSRHHQRLRRRRKWIRYFGEIFEGKKWRRVKQIVFQTKPTLSSNAIAIAQQELRDNKRERNRLEHQRRLSGIKATPKRAP